jgi:hypothetical protein
MKRAWVVLAAAVQLGCGTSTAPSQLSSSYFLSTLDGRPLPVPYGAEGSVLVASMLDFGTLGRPREAVPPLGTVRYVVDIKPPDRSIEHSEVDLNYAIEGGTLRIDLCPPLALCLIASELVGPINDDRTELVLTHYLGGRAGSVYRFVAQHPD